MNYGLEFVDIQNHGKNLWNGFTSEIGNFLTIIDFYSLTMRLHEVPIQILFLYTFFSLLSLFLCLSSCFGDGGRVVNCRVWFIFPSKMTVKGFFNFAFISMQVENTLVIGRRSCVGIYDLMSMVDDAIWRLARSFFYLCVCKWRPHNDCVLSQI